MEKKSTVYSLRNEPKKRFSIEAEAKGSGAQGSVVKATIRRQQDDHVFHYEVVFEDEFARTKANFTEQMYLDTALAIINSQIESHVHRDTRLALYSGSGVMRSEPGAALDWV